MCKIQSVFKHRLLFKLQIPSYIRQEFLQESVRKNDFSLRIICAIIFAVEIFNIARVVFWSRSGLRTQNNRIFLRSCGWWVGVRCGGSRCARKGPHSMW